MGNFVIAVEINIQNAILVAVNSIIAPRIQLVISSMHVSSERHVVSVMAISKREEQSGVTTLLRKHLRKMTNFTNSNQPNRLEGITLTR